MTQDLGSATRSETATPRLKSYRYVIEWCSAELSLDHAQCHYDLISGSIGRDRGYVQGGLIEQMPDEDVVSDSPLAIALHGAEAPPVPERTP